MKRHYTAKLNTGAVLGADSKCALYRNLKSYFAAAPDIWYAEIRIDGVPYAFVWKTPAGMNVVPIIE